MESFIQDWGYIALALYSFGGGMVALAIAGVLSFNGDLNIYISIIVAVVANIAGDQFLFYMARNNKPQARNIMGKYEKFVGKTENMMVRFGSFAIVLQKYIYGIKTLIPIIIGLTDYNTKRFLFWNILGAIIWGVIVGIVSYTLGNIVLTYLAQIKEYAIGILIVLILVIGYFLNKR
jgi:membrane protein DedA with SNARE-associated domain